MATRACSRRGVSWPWMAILLMVVAAAGLFLYRTLSYTTGSPLVVFCAASNQSVMEKIRVDYEREFKRPVQVQYGASQVLLASLEVSGSTADLFLPADSSYLDAAREKGLIQEIIPLAHMEAVVAVPRGNPEAINSWSALIAPDVKLAQGSPEATAIGKLTRGALDTQGQWQPLEAVTTVFAGTIHDAATAVKVGSVDAAIVFDAILHDYPELEALRFDELADVTAEVAIGVTTNSAHPTQALHLARYIAARDKGLLRYKEHGLQVVEGDPWEERPELLLYAGAMLRPAVEQTIQDFEEREGVRVTRVYNGCGILVAQMKAGEVPDAYFACDAQFMVMVQDLFGSADTISQNQLVILVQKGNPHHIASLVDLARPGLRVGIGHEKQCAMGWITQRTFEEGGVQDDVMKNVVVQTPTGDMLVNQMRTGSLDAAVVYISNAAGAADALDAVAIQGIPCSIALQPYATAQASPHKQLAARLLAQIRAEESRQRFLDEGFVWKVGETTHEPEAAAASSAEPAGAGASQ